MPAMSTSATHTAPDGWERGRRHLQCEAGRARVPMGQLVRQFGSGQTDRQRREKQVGWKVCFKQKNSTSMPQDGLQERTLVCVQSEAGYAGGGLGTQLTGLSSAMCQQTEEGSRAKEGQWPPSSLAAWQGWLHSLACSGHHKLWLPALNSAPLGTFRWGMEGWPLMPDHSLGTPLPCC